MQPPVTLAPSPAPSHPMGEHAIVIGSSVGGLLAAHVLAEHFTRVTLIERDRLPEDPVFRKGTPQARFTHTLLKKFWLLLDKRFPAMREELIAAGAVPIRWGADVLMGTPGGWLKPHDLGVDTVSLSRELLEWTLRRRVKANSRIHFLEETEVIGLTSTPDKSRVTGVRTRARGELKEPPPEQLSASLVIDVSGRDSKASKWLEELGYTAPTETTTDAHLRYVCRYFVRPKGLPWQGFFQPAFPPKVMTFTGLASIDGDRLIGGIVAPEGMAPPQDDEGFLEYARKLPTPYFYEILKELQPLTPLVGYQRTKNYLRHFEKLSRTPEQFLVMGDAVCALNPIYGQGITVLMLATEVLDATLKTHSEKRSSGDLTGLARFFQKQLAKSLQLPWSMSMSEDLRYPGVEGPKRTLPIRLMHGYFDRLFQHFASDHEIGLSFIQAIHMTAPPTSLFKPRVLFPTLFGTPRDVLTRPHLPLLPEPQAAAARPEAPASLPGNGVPPTGT